jgi:hypothetical protein
MKLQRVVVSDRMQPNYEYFLTQPTSECFPAEFQPQLSPPPAPRPQQMLDRRDFGGKYIPDCGEEFPDHWFKKARLSPEFHDPEINYFRANASDPLSYWRSKSWIYPEDPRGWLQW